jgi:hypothetical protein
MMSMKDSSREIWKEANIRVAVLKKSMEMKSVIELRKMYATDALTLWLQKRGTQGSSHSRCISTTIEGT